MTVNDPGAPPPAPAWKPLTAAQRRVLGVLIEKAKTTPAGYPMSVNAVAAGCNQKSNRDPLTSYDEGDVEHTIGELRDLGVVTEVDWLGRVPKYKHRAYEWLGVDKAELAVLAELLLRGAQSIGDLRARAARMENIEDLNALRPILERLVSRHLVIELTPPGRGQMVTHGLYPPAELEALKGTARSTPRRFETAEHAGSPAFAAGSATAAMPPAASLADEVAALRAEVGALRARVVALELRAGKPDDS